MNRHRANGMNERALRRKELGAFLRARRESISPDSVGLAKFGRRRTPGLRREEVAMLAEIGTGWYTKLETAHDVKPSPATLWAIARVLRLDRGETEFVFSLADVAIPLEAVGAARDPRIPLAMEKLVDDLTNLGVVVLDRYMTVVRWNAIADGMFDISRHSTTVERNVIVRLLEDQSRAVYFDADWQEVMRTIIGMFRRVYLNEPSGLAQEIYERASSSEVFRKLWRQQNVADDMFDYDRPMAREHPLVGTYRVIASNFHVVSRTDYLVRIIAPADAESAEKFARLAELGTRSPTLMASG
jgi:transcriptional regulator with XRE-family HTH domain